MNPGPWLITIHNPSCIAFLAGNVQGFGNSMIDLVCYDDDLLDPI